MKPKLDTSDIRSWPWFIFTWLCIGLGIAGFILPLMPGFVFLLIAAWAAPKGSAKAEKWLNEHPRFGPMLKDWEEHRAVSPFAKIFAIVFMSFSWLLLWYNAVHQFILVAVILIFIAVAAYLISLPSSKK